MADSFSLCAGGHGGIDLSYVQRIGVDETSSERGHQYVTVFIDVDRSKGSVIFAVPGKGKEPMEAFGKFLKERGGCVLRT